jgi:hypothetical protein
MVSCVGVAHARSPERRGKDDHRQKKENAGDLKPEDAAHATKRPKESRDTLTHAVPSLSCNAACGLCAGPALHDRCRLNCRRLRSACGRWCLCRDALTRNSTGDSHSYAQNPANVSRFHTVYDGSSGTWRALRKGRGARLLSDGNGSKVEIPRRNPSIHAWSRSGGIFMTSRLRELIQQLGEAIHESVIESEQIAGVVQDIRKHGFDVLLMLEATIGLNEVTAGNNKKGELNESSSDTSGETGSFTQNDLHFLKSLRISVEGDDEAGEIDGNK